MATSVLTQGVTQDGYSFILFAEGYKARRRFWWTCGGCWSRCEPSPNEDKVRDHGNVHVLYCTVFR